MSRLLLVLWLAVPAFAAEPDGGDEVAEDAKIAQTVLAKIETLPTLPKEKVSETVTGLMEEVSRMKDPDAMNVFFTQLRPYLENLQRQGPSAGPGPQVYQAVTSLGEVVPARMKELAPSDPRGWSAAGQDLLLRREYEPAFHEFDRALRLGASDPDTYSGYASAAYNLGDYALAVEAASRALRVRPGHPGALAVRRLSEGRVPRVRLSSALSSAREILERPLARPAALAPPRAAGPAPIPPGGAPDVERAAALSKQAGEALMVKDFAQAHALATQAVALNARSAQGWNLRAIADVRLGRYDDAVRDASAALALVPGSPAALQTRSWALSKLGRQRDALADANYTLEREPDNAFAYQNRAFALAGMGDRSGALEALRRSAELDARFRARYDQALQAPLSSDLTLLFDESAAAAPPPAPGDRRRLFLRLMLYTVVGGVLVALGVLHVVSAGWREKVQATIRRVLAGPATPGIKEAPAIPRGFSGEALAIKGSETFWSQYQLARELGSGGMGVVYEAKDLSLGRRVAVKKMRDEIRADPLERGRFVTEARTVASLHHPNIVDIYAIVEDANDVYLVFEYVSGRTLAAIIQQGGALSFDEARRVLKGACAAVEHAHKHQVIHRDMKPSNIMVSEEGLVKVMDFGVARQAKEALTKLTKTNTIAGTPPYMAPEQEQGTVRRESDVFALGVCFYEMLTGRLPFAGQGAGMLLNKIQGRYAPLEGVVPGLPPGLDRVVARALSPDPDKRYRTPSDFLSALEGLPG